MGLLDLLSGAQDIAHVTISFQDDGKHNITIKREPTAPAYLDGPVLDAALFLYYTAKAFHALGSGPASDELRQHIALSGVVLSADKFEPFTSLIDQHGQCIGRLQINRAGALSINTSFRVPLLETTNYVLDSVLLMFTHAVENQPTAEHRKCLADAVQALDGSTKQRRVRSR